MRRLEALESCLEPVPDNAEEAALIQEAMEDVLAMQAGDPCLGDVEAAEETRAKLSDEVGEILADQRCAQRIQQGLGSSRSGACASRKRSLGVLAPKLTAKGPSMLRHPFSRQAPVTLLQNLRWQKQWTMSGLATQVAART